MNAQIKRADLATYVAMTIIAISGLNLNGLAFMMFGVSQALSPILFAGSLYLVFATGRISARDPVLVSFAVFIFLYLSIGSVSASPQHAPIAYALTYGSSLLIVFGLSAFVSSRMDASEIQYLLRFTKFVLLTASLSVIASGKLNALYINRLSSMDRPGGFFGNANEAGIAAVAALALVLAHPSRHRILNIAGIMIASSAILLSFSKSSLLIALVIPVLVVLLRPNVARIVAVAAGIAGVWFFIEVFVQSSDLGVAGSQFGGSQKARLEEFLDILSGNINEENTTGRTHLWAIAIDRIEQSLLFGHGLGSFHHMIGGVTFDGVWMGAHNVYLMAWGEAGLLAFVALTISMLLYLFHAVRPGAHIFPILYFTILQFDMMAAHNVLGLRFHNVLLGLCMGLMLWERRNGFAHAAGEHK